MRKTQKQQIEALLVQMEEAHKQIEQYIGQNNIQSAMELLEDCQAGGVAAGTLIKNTEGEGHPAVALLEEYCGLIYQTHQNLEDDFNKVNANEVYKNLRKRLIKIENSVKNNIKVRTEAVFLPYKASMWDSLESVWKAFDADPNCDAYVIPIPYFDKNPDGSFRQMHYEGNEYPDYVQIVSWDEYDIGERHPDVIYIHNPYDEFNLVTSVHPAFYSKELKKYTDKLIYVPYFILNEIEPDDHKAVKSMEHFCTVPGVIHADQVIVQSEKMRQIYINVLSEIMGEKTRHIWEKKILGLGSPKIDKVLNTRKEDLEIPGEWLEIIKKPDGTWKRIVFYNTSVSALLQHDVMMLQKMEYVFETFKENQKDVALLWRPHPLIQATIASMRPQLWTKYKKIVEQYREEGWGIYDDSADMDRAVILSDMYYGDGSSIVQLYQETGKPLMMQDVQILKPKRYQYDIASAEAICSYQGDYYFVFMQAPLLCKVNRETLECELLYRFWEGKLYGRLYRKIILYQEQLFLIPFMSDRIAVYNIISGEMQFILLNEEYVDIRWHENLVSSKFEDALVQGKFLYMIPYSYHALIKMDMESLQVVEIPLGKRGKNIFCYCRGSACLQRKQIIFPIQREGCICVFNTDTNAIDRVYPSGTQKKYSNIFSIEDQLWLIPEKLYEGIDLWDIDSKTIKRTLMPPEEISLMSKQNETMDVWLGFFLENKLYLLAFGLACSITIDLNSGETELWKLPHEYRKEEFLPQDLYRYQLRHSSVISKENGFLVCGLCGEWIECDRDGIRMIERQSVWSRDLILALSLEKPGIIIPESRLDLREYITLSIGTEMLCAAEKVSNGKAIYQYISGQSGY